MAIAVDRRGERNPFFGRKHTSESRALMRECKLGTKNANWRHGQQRYNGVHQQLVKVRGRAAEHLCTDCAGPAHEWSYVGGAPDEELTPDGTPFSYDFSHYVPRCRPCHRQFDRTEAA